MTAGEDMSEQLKLRSAVVGFILVNACSSLIPERREETCDLHCGVALQFDDCVCVWGGVCRPGLGVLQQQGHRLQRGGENHGLWRPLSGVELGPAV